MTTQRLTLRERAEFYMSLIGPLVMIFAIMPGWQLSHQRDFRLSNFDIILNEAALYMPMAMG